MITQTDMKCKDCGSKHIVKNGTAPIRRKGIKKRSQIWLCKECFHQWVDK